MKKILLRPILIVGTAWLISALTPPTQCGPSPIWTLASMLACLAIAVAAIYVPYTLKAVAHRARTLSRVIHGAVTLVATVFILISLELLDDLIARIPGMSVEMLPIDLTPNQLVGYWLVGTFLLLVAAKMIGMMRLQFASEPHGVRA